MGQLISSDGNNHSNDDLINTLIRRQYITSPDVERVFRCVDRGLYYTSDNKADAYRDSAWLYEKVHLSAPSIYAIVLECLDLCMGNKFLNIGSGVGYFSTVAGLLLGVYGVNHGIEIHQSLIDIAYQKLEEFKLNAAGIDYFELCEPVFIEGNVCELTPAGYYDRVYCGAGVSPAEAEFMKSLINIGGVLVMPLDGYLVKIIRESEHLWKTIKVLEVQFSELVVPEKCSFNTVKFPSVEPMSLQELCRSSIRSNIRGKVTKKNSDLEMRIKCKHSKSHREKLNNGGNPITEFVRLQYGISQDGLINVRNIVDAFAGLDDAISDMGSTSGNEANEDEEDDDDNNSNDDDDDDDDDEGENASEQCDEPSKRKLSEAGCSEQNKTLPEIQKKMRLSTSSDRHTTSSQSSSSNDGFWQTVSDNSSEADNDSDSWVSSLENLGLVNDDDDFGGVYNSLFDSDRSNTESEIVKETIKYTFLNKRKDNMLSKILKKKIDMLPVPSLIKVFLNYSQRD